MRPKKTNLESGVAIIGGGLQGCLAALAISAAGKSRVTIFERRAKILHGASRNNEGKIHAGFTYGLDPSMDTARLLVAHAGQFWSILSRLLDRESGSLIRHFRGIYALHRGSVLPREATDIHMRNVDRCWRERHAASGARPELGQPLRIWSESETSDLFGPDVQAAYEVSEAHVDWHALCDTVADAVEGDARISVHTGVRIVRVDQGSQLSLISEDGTEAGRADTVVNCAWEDLAGIARRSGVGFGDCCLRVKAGFIAGGGPVPPRPVTFSFGPFGDIVPIDSDRAYVSWYPACLAGFTTDVDCGATWYNRVRTKFDPTAAYRASIGELSRLVPRMALAENYMSVQIGVILAAGHSDIVDRQSGLHRRTAIGINRRGRLISVNTGKLVSAPTFADEVAKML